MAEIRIAKTIHDMRAWREDCGNARVGLVPTMGALHQGHLDLMREARQRSDKLAVSIFVNPTQFGPDEDLDRYPRDFAGDEKKCAELGVDCIFYPSADMMYPTDFNTFVEVEHWSQILEGEYRPGHFRGVTTVVLKLLNIVQPHVAVFGWKDAQQFIILRKMVADLNLPLEMVACETTREPDGLAMSSRNAYLSNKERAQASVLNRALQAAKQAFEAGECNAEQLVGIVRKTIENHSAARLDYVACVSSTDLTPLREAKAGSTLLALAARFGSTRLIDNIRF